MVATSSCPSISDRVLISNPASTALVAKVCRLWGAPHNRHYVEPGIMGSDCTEPLNIQYSAQNHSP